MKFLLKCFCILSATMALASAQTSFKELWHKPAIGSATFSPDGSMIAAGSPTASEVSAVFLLNAQDGSLIKEWSMGKSSIPYVQFAPQGHLLAASSTSRIVNVLSLSSKELVYSINTQAPGAPIAFSPTASVLAVANNYSITLYNSENGSLIRSWNTGTNTHELAAINAIAFLPDGKFLATGSGARGVNVALKLWDVATGAELWSQPTAQTYGIDSIAVSPDGQSLVTGSAHLHFPGPLQIWDARTGDLRHTFPWPAFSAAFSPQASALLTINTNLVFWSLPPRILSHQNGISSTKVLFNPAGDRFLTADRTLRVFETPLIIVNPQLSGSQLTFQAIGPTNRYTLETSGLASPWMPYSQTSTSTSIPVENGMRFFRLKQ